MDTTGYTAISEARATIQSLLEYMQKGGRLENHSAYHLLKLADTVNEIRELDIKNQAERGEPLSSLAVKWRTSIDTIAKTAGIVLKPVSEQEYIYRKKIENYHKKQAQVLATCD